MFQSPGDVAFSIYGFPVYYYGITLAFAILVGVYTAYALYKKFYGIDKAECIIDFSPYIIVLGVVGARLYYCLVNYSYYLVNPLQIFNIRQGGLSIHGMIFVGILSLWMFSKIYKMSFSKIAGCVLCGTLLHKVLADGETSLFGSFGAPTNLPWKLFIPVAKRPLEFISNEYFHPTFLYESILDLLIFVVLLLFFKKFSKKPGIIACCYLIMYSFARIAVEQIRLDSALNIQGIPVAQIASLVLLWYQLYLLL